MSPWPALLFGLRATSYYTGYYTDIAHPIQGGVPAFQPRVFQIVKPEFIKLLLLLPPRWIIIAVKAVRNETFGSCSGGNLPPATGRRR